MNWRRGSDVITDGYFSYLLTETLTSLRDCWMGCQRPRWPWRSHSATSHQALLLFPLCPAPSQCLTSECDTLWPPEEEKGINFTTFYSVWISLLWLYYYYCTVCKCLQCKIAFVCLVSSADYHHVTVESILIDSRFLSPWRALSLLWLVGGECVSLLCSVIYFLCLHFLKLGLGSCFFSKDGNVFSPMWKCFCNVCLSGFSGTFLRMFNATLK